MDDIYPSLVDPFAANFTGWSGEVARRLADLAPGAPVKVHAFRAALPWRAERLTECGKLANEHTLEHVELVKLQADYEAALPAGWNPRTDAPYCSTCIGNVTRAHRFSDDPVEVLEREITRSRSDPRLAIELRAAAQLITAHRDEFDTIVKRERAHTALNGGRT